MLNGLPLPEAIKLTNIITSIFVIGIFFSYYSTYNITSQIGVANPN